jgi:hypothetical protein
MATAKDPMPESGGVARGFGAGAAATSAALATVAGAAAGLAAAGVAGFIAGVCGVRVDFVGAAGSVAAAVGLAWIRMADS